MTNKPSTDPAQHETVLETGGHIETQTETRPTTSDPLLTLSGISKTFPGVRALQDVSLSLWAGEVHMLMGENGAGKSTLMKVMCGAYEPDAGEFRRDGIRVEVRNGADARRLGVAVIFQEFSLVPYLNIAQNIFLGREPMRRLPGIIDHQRMHRDAREVLKRLDFDVDTHAMVASLGVAQQQLVEIAKALSQHARILVLDEPTAALSDRESERLFKIIADLKAGGVAMAYISHRMEEVFELGDRVSVLRDGKLVASMPASQAMPNELVALMVGRKVDMAYTRDARPQPGRTVLEVKELAAANGVHDISMKVRAGEIVGLAGLVGSGRTELARAIFGVDPVTKGEVLVNGKEFRAGPPEARECGMAFIPENRKLEGLALERTVGDNLLMAAMPRCFPKGWYIPAHANKLARDIIGQLRISTRGPHTQAQMLSGGSQQKVVIGKWLLDDAQLFIFDEPTRGIDVGAKEQIFELIDGLVRQGRAVLMISSEIGEIIRVCDRAYVMKDKTIAGHLEQGDLDEVKLVRLAVHRD